MRGRTTTRTALIATGLLSALTLAACSGGGVGLGTGSLPYQSSNAIMPQGYSESQIGPDRYRIDVKGPLNTPRERLEKIAATRAAEIGKDNRLGYFKIENVQQTNHCKRYIEGGQRGSNTQEKVSAYTMLTAEVSYSKQPGDPAYLDSRQAFDQYRAELDLPQAGAAAALSDTAQCS